MAKLKTTASITKSLVEKIVRDPASPEFVMCSTLVGFGIRHHGSSFSFVVLKAYTEGGKRRTLKRSLGPATPEGLADARKRAIELLAAIQVHGRDLIGETKAERRVAPSPAPEPEPTPEPEENPYALDKVLAIVEHRHRTYRTSAASRSYLRIAARMFADFADLRCLTVNDAKMIRSRVASMTVTRDDQTVAASTGHRQQVYRFVRAIVAVLVAGTDADDLDGVVLAPGLGADPFANLKPVGRYEPREVTPSLADMATIWRHAGTGTYADLVRLIMLLPLRREEWAQARMADVDLAKATFTVPAERAKNGRAHTLPLCGTAVAILAARKLAGALQPADFIFASRADRAKPYSAFSAAKDWLDDRMAKAGAVLDEPEWRLHDLRRGYVSALADLGVDETVADLLLTHSQSSTRGGIKGIYQRSRREGDLRAAVQRFEHALLAEVERQAGAKAKAA